MDSHSLAAIANTPAEWSGLSDERWVELHVTRFEQIRARYVAYAAFLEALLARACGPIAPVAIISARPKTIASFAEKILRKRKAYTDPRDPQPPDPLARVTDLCGARVIAQTAEQVKAVSQFIEETFDVDWANSEDTARRLLPTEFGYRSVHYIVCVNPGRLRAAGITLPVPPELVEPTPLKAELQVRTLLEHAWADLAHDLTYKTAVRVPEKIRRQFAAIAAVLEGTDRDFGRLVQELGEFNSNFGAYHRKAETEDEIARLRIVLAHNPENVEQAVKIAQLAMSIGQHAIALDVLAPYRGTPHQGVQRAVGLALCEAHWDRPRSVEFIEGREFLERACAHPKTDAETLCALAESWSLSDKSKAREVFRRAAATDGTEPLTLCRYLEFEIDHHNSDAVVSLVAPMIRGAMERCRKQIEGRVNLPVAWACLGVFHLLLKEPFDAVRALAQVINLCETAPTLPCTAGRVLQRTRDSLGRLDCVREQLPGFDWVHRVVLLGLAVRVREPEAMGALRRLASWGHAEAHFTATDQVVIFAGGCAPDAQQAMDALRPHLLVACDGLSFTLLGGGTRMGISGLAGDVAEASAGRIRAFGYLPRALPRHVHQDENVARFGKLVSSAGTEFTPLEPLQGWTDLITAGVEPGRVKLLGYAGGEIARAEYAVALALGARVGIVDDPLLPRERRFEDSAWQDHANLVRLPLDRMTLRAFLLMDGLPARRAEFALAAQHVHEDYVRSAAPREPSLLAWPDLPDDLKLSSFHQVAYAENILRTAGLGVRPLADPGREPLDLEREIGADAIRRLAEMEHGRWNVERLLLGWRYAETKDVGRKLSPYLVPWHLIPARIQDYDVQAIRALPRTLQAAGLEVFVLPEA